MSNTILESLWSRIDANIGSRITQISDLLTQALSANTEAKTARDEAVAAAENAQQGAPDGGWKKADLTQPVQDSLSRADTALQYVPVATSSAPGAIRLTGDLGGTAQSPTVPGLAGKANATHTHTQAQVTGLSTALNGKANASHTHTVSNLTDYPGHTAIIGPSSHGKIPVRESDSDNLRVGYPPAETYHATSKKYVDDEVAKKANTSHTHAISDVTGLQAALDSKPTHSTMNSGLNGKADKSHTHTTSQISGLGTALNGKADKSQVDEVSGRVSSLEDSTPIIVSSLPASPLPGRIYLVTE